MTDVYKSKKKQYLIILGLIIFNLIIYNLFVKNGGYDAKGNYLPYDRGLALKSSLISFLFAIPLLSFIIGAVVALFPYKKLAYTKKYKRSVISTLLVINTVFSTLLIIIVIMTLIGWYPAPQEETTQTHTITQTQKNAKIKKFESEVKILIDSSNYYFVIGINALDLGKDSSEITNLISTPLKRLEDKIGERTMSFSETAYELQLTKNEVDSVFKNLGIHMESVQEKYNRLSEKGVKLN